MQISKTYSLNENTVELITKIAQLKKWDKSTVVEVAVEMLAASLIAQNTAETVTQTEE